MTLRDTHVTMAHGGGGRAMRDLIDEVFTSVFQPPGSEDQARLMTEALQQTGARLAFTTDSFVVTPLEFPGGDIGKLAVCGTVNDLAVGGAKPLWLSAAFVIEEGCEIALLRRIVATMAAEAAKAGVRIVTGDTKVVDRGKGDGVYITTAGIGVIPPGIDIGAAKIRPGDVVLVNGVLGDHGAAILAARGDLALSTDLQSDCAGLGHLMQAALAAAPGISAARDCTRGGLASALNEMAAEARCLSNLRKRNCPFAPKSPASAKSLASTRSILRTKAALSSSAPRIRPTPPLPRCAPCPKAKAPVLSAAPEKASPAASPCAPHSAAPASST